MENKGFDNTFYYYFLVGPSSEIEEGNWNNSKFYTDKNVMGVINERGVIGNHMEEMPDTIYDLAWDEISRIYETR